VARIHTVADARRIARRRVPPAVFDYIEGGAGEERTLAANREAIEAVGFVPRMGVTAGIPLRTSPPPSWGLLSRCRCS